MKYLALLTLALGTLPAAARAQAIHFEQDSLAQVFAKARQQNKPVLVLLAGPLPPASLPPALKKARGESGLNSPAVSALLNKDFLNKAIAFGSAEGAEVGRKYTVTGWPTYLYFSPDGELLHRRLGNNPTEQRYLQDLQAVRQAQSDPQSLSGLRAQLQRGKPSASLLRQYIGKRQQLKQTVEPDLLDAYAAELPVHAFDQAAEVTFVLESGPVVGSKAYQLTRLNTKLYDSLYQALPLPQRVAINKAIIANTMAQAIATRDRNLAAKAAEFARTSWSKNYARGLVAYETNMLRFYSATKDTASYLRQAVSYYERTNQAVSADSARKVVAALRAFRQQQAANQPHLVPASVVPGQPADASRTAVVQAVPYGNSPPSFLMELNNAAWSIYQTGTRNGQYLWRATQWSKRTVELDPAPYHCDTLAHLLYRLRFFYEAEAMQQQAVATARQEKTATTPYELELEKIKKRTL